MKILLTNLCAVLVGFWIGGIVSPWVMMIAVFAWGCVVGSEYEKARHVRFEFHVK